MKKCIKCEKPKTNDYFLKSEDICKTCLRKEVKFKKSCNKCKIKRPTSEYNKNNRICDDCFEREYLELLNNKKICSKCEKEKDLNRFGKGRVCFDCVNFLRQTRIKEGKSKLYPTSKEKMKKWRSENKERLKLYRKEYSNRKYNTDVNYKLAVVCRSFIKRCLFKKNGHRTHELLGYSPDKLKQRIECQFTKDMSWENYGEYWNIDHRKPIKMFKPDTKISTINMLCNLRPVKKEENFSKQGRFIS